MSLRDTVSGWARRMKRDAVALWFACRDPRAPWTARLLCGLVVAYALSPIDLIPDFVPVLGLLDDIVILPLGILLLVKMMPAELMQELRKRAARLQDLPASRAGLLAILAIWRAAAAMAALWIARRLS